MMKTSFIVFRWMVPFALLTVISQTADAQRQDVVLIGGIPALRYMNDAGESVIVTYQYIRNWREEAFVIPTAHQKSSGWTHIPDDWCFGVMYITKNRIVYVPNDDQRQDHAFNTARSALKKFKIYEWKHKGLRYQALELKGEGIKGDLYYVRENDSERRLSSFLGLIGYISLMGSDFDSAVKEYQGRTASARSEIQSSSSIEQAATPNVDGKKTLYEQFFNNRQTDPDLAYQAAKAYLQNYPDDENSSYMKRWIAAYEKVKARDSGPPAVNTPSVAVRSSPVTAESYAKLGDQLANEGKWAEAEAQYQQAVQMNPNNARWHTNLGIALDRQKKWLQAEASFRQAVRLEPNTSLWHSNLAFVLGAQQKWVEAEAECRQAIRLEPKKADWHVTLGDIFYGQQRWAEAESEYRMALKVGPPKAAWHNALAYALTMQKKEEQAEAEIKKAIKLDPNNAKYLSNLDDLKEKERDAITRELIGIESRDLNSDTRGQLNLAPNSNGVLVVLSERGSPAARAGIRRDDLITAINGQSITSRKQFNQIIAKTKSSDILAVQILRAGQQYTLTVQRGDK